MTSPKAQGATEYLVIFAVVLIIAMVAVGLLGFAPSIFGSANESATSLYWSSQKPIRLDSWSAAADGTVSLSMQNNGMGQIVLTQVSFSRSSDLSNPDISSTLSLPIQAGRSTTYTGPQVLSPANRCATGTSFSYYLTLYYTDNGQPKVFPGAKPIVGHCG